LIHGADSFGSRSYVDQLVALFKKKHGEAARVVTVDAAEEDPLRIVDHISAGDLFGGTRLVIARSFLDAAPARDALGSFLKQVDYALPDTVSLIVYHGGAVDGRLSLAQRLKKEEHSKEFKKPNPRDMARIIIEQAQAHDISFDKDALALFTQAVGDSGWRASSEIQKLSHFSGKTITAEDVRTLVYQGHDQIVWRFVDALSTHNKRTAYKELDGLVGAGGDPAEIASMLARQIRIILALYGAGGDNESIASETHLHPFVVQKTRAQARSFTQTELSAMMFYLARMEEAIKRDYRDPVMLMTLFIDKFMK